MLSWSPAHAARSNDAGPGGDAFLEPTDPAPERENLLARELQWRGH